MMKSYSYYLKSLQWNSFESIVYHAVYSAHQIVLFKVISGEMYGLIASLFSSIYLGAYVINWGFDHTLAAVFYSCTKPNRQMISSFKNHILFNVTTGIFFAFIFYGLMFFDFHFIKLNTHQAYLFIVIFAISVTECVRKTFKTVLQLTLNPHIPALVEIGMIVSYVSLVWLLFLYTQKITLQSIFISMLLVSLTCTTILGWFVKKWYVTLPDTSENNPKIFITKNRLKNVFYQISAQVFSSNFLITFFALHFGFEQAGILKITCNLAHSISIIIQKIFGTASKVVLSHMKHQDFSEKRRLFFMITSHLNQILYAIIIILAINYKFFFDHTQAQISLLTFLIFFLINFQENFFLIYEKFTITQEKAEILGGANIISSLLFFMLFIFGNTLPPRIFLTIVFMIRGLCLICIVIISHYLWGLKAAWKFQPQYIASALLLSLLIYFIT